MINLKNFLAESLDPNKEPLYAAIVLNDASVRELKSLVNTELTKLENFNANIICHHSTIAFGKDLDDNILKWCDKNDGREMELTAFRLGISDKAIAVEVQTNAPCKNVRKHITLATNLDNHGKPVDSNYITNWKPLENKITLRGEITIFYKR